MSAWFTIKPADETLRRLVRERNEARDEVERLMKDAKSLEGIIDSLERRIDGPDGLLAKVERLSRERDEARAEVRRMRELLVTIQRLNSERDVALSRERDEARAALKPFARLFLWPDDLDSSSAAYIRAEEDWNEAENDARSDDLWVRRGDIRAARKAVKAE